MGSHGYASPGEWGSAEHPLIMSGTGWAMLHAWLRERMVHVHMLTGQCLLNRTGAPCAGQGSPWGQDCYDPSCSRPAVVEDDNGWACGVHQCL